ncbi:hypothetical protein NMY22_g10747 [Coprinellus aureogranulatus]|nr:hypothetical protein NMY22_g10747 [Coprinellus aureogranulatus]
MAPTEPHSYSLKKRYLDVPVTVRIPPASRRQWPRHAQPCHPSGLAASSAKIPRPKGEAGRPGRGGFALKATLEWPSQRYSNVQRVARDLVRRRLDVTKPFTEQNEETLEEVRDEIALSFPEINRYDKKWPASEFIKAVLKNAPRYRKQPDANGSR